MVLKDLTLWGIGIVLVVFFLALLLGTMNTPCVERSNFSVTNFSDLSDPWFILNAEWHSFNITTYTGYTPTISNVVVKDIGSGVIIDPSQYEINFTSNPPSFRWINYSGCYGP